MYSLQNTLIDRYSIPSVLYQFLDCCGIWINELFISYDTKHLLV